MFHAQILVGTPWAKRNHRFLQAGLLRAFEMPTKVEHRAEEGKCSISQISGNRTPTPFPMEPPRGSSTF